MSEIRGQIEHIAQTKTAAGVGIGGATATTWVDWVLNDPTFQAAIILAGFILTLTLIAVHGITICRIVRRWWKKR